MWSSGALHPATWLSSSESLQSECLGARQYHWWVGEPHSSLSFLPPPVANAIMLLVGDGPSLRDYVIRMGLLPPLFQLVNDSIPQTFLCNITWVLVNICRCKSPPVQLTIARQLLPMLSSLLTHEDCNVCDFCLSPRCDGCTSSWLIIRSGCAGHCVGVIVSDRLRQRLHTVGTGCWSGPLPRSSTWQQ